jgi:hypothetical protein
MTQAFRDKCEAICSLLGLMLYHLDDAPGRVIIQRQEWISEPSPLDPPRSLPDPYNVACEGRCQDCLNALKTSGRKPDCPPDELWVRERDALRRSYRMDDVEDALMRLSDCDPTHAQAVWAVYVEPWPDPKTEPIAPETRVERARLADEGIGWMACTIQGDVRSFGEQVDDLDNEIRRLRAAGLSQRRIAKRLHCRPEKVGKVLSAGEAICA